MAAAPFNWSEFLRLAADLSQSNDEASHRTSISRTYYSVFHAATIQAAQNGYAGHSHRKLWAVYAKDANRQCKKLAQLAYTMKFAREDADYNAAVPQISNRMTQQLIDATNFMIRLRTLPSTAPQP